MKGSNHHLCPKMCVHRGGDRCPKAMACSIESRVSTFLFCWEAGYPHLNIFWQSRSWDGKLCTSVKKPVLPSKGSHQPFRHHHSISGMLTHKTIGIYSLFRGREHPCSLGRIEEEQRKIFFFPQKRKPPCARVHNSKKTF